MTLAESALEPPRWFSIIRNVLSYVRRRHVSTAAIAHLDDRLRADVGLPPAGDRSPLPHEAAARIAMLALR